MEEGTPSGKLLAPRMCRSTNRQPEPEVWFRIIHTAQAGRNGAPVAAYREQTVEVALGPKGAFENVNVGALTRQISTGSVVTATQPRGKPKPANEPKTPRVVELLRKAIEWRRQIDSGEIRNLAQIARREGITRARVTQIMAMLRLPPETRERILSFPDTSKRPPITERVLRTMRITNRWHERRARISILVSDSRVSSVDRR